MTDLGDLGYAPFFERHFRGLEDADRLVPARVIADGRDIYELAGCRRVWGEVSGALRHGSDVLERPTTGDWVAVEDGSDRAVIHHVLPRRSLLLRRAAGTASTPQPLAANVDVYFIVTSANEELNPRRLERYLTAVWDSGASPIVVLNKVDLAQDIAPMRRQIEAVARAVDVVGVSASEGIGMEGLSTFLQPGRTVGFIGSSGVGKSTLVNWLRGQATQATREIRADSKGRHTTTRRELVVLPSGAVLVDTPGMRELGLLDSEQGLHTAFADVAAFAEHCRFRNCQHASEPGCAVTEAAGLGRLPVERLESYRKLQREVAATEARSDPVLRANTKRRWKSLTREIRAITKHKV